MPENLIERFFKAVAEERMSLKEVARAAGVSSETIERLRSGQTKRLDLLMVHAVSKKARNQRSFWNTILGDSIGLNEDIARNYDEIFVSQIQKIDQLIQNNTQSNSENSLLIADKASSVANGFDNSDGVEIYRLAMR